MLVQVEVVRRVPYIDNNDDDNDDDDDDDDDDDIPYLVSS